MRKGFLRAYLLLGLFLFAGQVFADAGMLTIAGARNPCEDSFLAVINRPTASDSPCTVTEGSYALEAGGQMLALSKGNGTGYIVPQAELRFGLASKNEFYVLLPSLSSQSSPQTTGFTASGLGLKHELWSSEKAIFSVDYFLILPGTSAAFGSRQGGALINGVFGFSLPNHFSLSGVLGAGMQSEPTAVGGAGYFTVNPDIVLAWNPYKPFQVFGEAYGQTNTGPGQGAGYNLNTGIQYLITPNVEVDIEGGVRLTGGLGDFERYVGMGFGILF